MLVKDNQKSTRNRNDISSNDAKKSSNDQSGLPSISLPKGGGAIRGIGEKFAANPVTGTGSLSVPIFTSPGRSGFGPSLSLSYDSGSGNGPFGFGWNLSLPFITRKTSKGIPKYHDADESDVFILSGAEDLVPVYRKDDNGEFEKDGDGNFIIDEGDRDGYTVRRYRPRTEGLFALIERWTDRTNGHVHWRSISKDNILTVYGKSSESRIADPSDESGRRIFSWLICQSYDDKGNAVVYEYAKEDEKGIDNYLLSTNERNRIRTANRYIKRIFYGNHKPFLIDETRDSFRKSHLEISDSDLASTEWMFRVVFDYDENHFIEIPLDSSIREDEQHQLVEASHHAGRIWSGRPDPFSAFRSSFEIRTYRRCHRVLMFHQFPELGDEPYLVRSTEFDYSDFDYSEAAAFTVSDELNHKGSTRIASFIQSVTQSGYVKDETRPVHNVNGAKYFTYLKKSIPPLEFEYSKCAINHEIKDLDETTLENLPTGLDGMGYQLVDLDGESVPGILIEQADTLFYKPNLGGGKFGPIETVAAKPSIADLNSGRQQLMDLAGDGQLDLVETGGPVPGFYERNHDRNWENFVSFQSIPNVAWNDPNLRLVDLTGDSHPDILITGNGVFTWYQSLAEKGFEPSSRVIQELDEEKGPRLVLREGTQSVYLADMSGDGLSDLVRITKGEVCYWPNLGYGRFGSKVTMDNCPWFDSPDQFDNNNIRLADIDGSGETDIIYVGGNENKGIKIYFNQSGNRWSDVYYLDSGLQIDDNTSIQVADLSGNGTACLVWSSTLPGNSRKPMRYLDLMGGIKPHLLVKSVNNLGAETQVEYVSSTKFYLADKAAGKPWITRLPFPVHVVERVITYDYIGRNLFVTKSAYHHGYFDGIEQEFRGFGMVEQWDTEEFATLSNSDNLPILNAANIEEATHVPPVYTKTWFHTGVYLGREHVSDFFGGLIDIHDRGEYYREPEWRDDDIEARKHLLDDTILPTDLTIDEEYEACRGLRGSMIRQEVYSRDGTEKEVHPYTVNEQNFAILLLQPRGKNQSAVFFTHPREELSYHYERKLFPVLNGQVIDERTVPVDPTNPDIKWIADPRVQHAVTLDVDDYGNVLKSVAIAYGRRLDAPDSALLPEDREKQRLIHIISTENKFTNPVIDKEDAYRTPLPAETSTYELRKPMQEKSEPGLVIKLYKFDELRNHVNQVGHDHDINYEDIDFTQANNPNDYFRRLIEQVRILYRPDDLGIAENNPLTLLPLGMVELLGLTGETYKLAFTPGLLAQVYERDGQTLLLPNHADVLSRGDGGDKGGYIQSQQFKAQGTFPDSDPDDYWWAPSGRTFMSPNMTDPATEEFDYADKHFFLPLRYRNPFHTEAVSTESSVTLDNYTLLIVESHDPLDNLVTAENDYRVLQPRRVTDPNRNRTEVAFDTLGMVVGMAVTSKDASEGDTLEDFEPDLTQDDINRFYYALDPHVNARDLLKSATTRIIYDPNRFHRLANRDDPASWLPVFAAILVRETHGGNSVKIQISFSYSDGFGRVIQRKIQAEPGPLVKGGPPVDPRWVTSGWTIPNNKGLLVRKYEPFFSRGHQFEFGVTVGVSPILFYDPVGRVVAILHANDTYEKAVFGPWKQVSYDVNDTVTEHGVETGDPRTDADIQGYVAKYFALNDPTGSWQTWFDQRRPTGTMPVEDQAAAEKAAAHADTPATDFFDTLGRPFLKMVHNRFDRNAITVNEMYATRIELDIEGNQREVRDATAQNGGAMGRIVMQYNYDMLGNRIHQLSMEAGARWILNDVSAKPLRSWDSRGHTFRFEYDPLRRLLRLFVLGSNPSDLSQELLSERYVYGENVEHPQDEQLNLRGKLYLRLDQAGMMKNERFDFKGNTLHISCRLAKDYKQAVDWRAVDDNSLAMLEAKLQDMLEGETFSARTSYDALNRVTQLIKPHSHQPGVKINVVQPIYNEANLLQQMNVWLNNSDEPDRLLDPALLTPSLVGVNNINYNAKGQRIRIDYKNGVATTYDYDPYTFRLIHLMTLRDDLIFPQDCPGHPPSGWPGCRIQSLHYTYDPVGNITRIHDEAQQTIFFRNKRVKPTSEYVYDAIYRLTKATGREHLGQSPGGGALNPPIPSDHRDERRVNIPHPGDGNAMGIYEEHYAYDFAGNILEVVHRGTDPSHPGWTLRNHYNEPSLIESSVESNRLSGHDAGIAHYTYDSHGSMTSMPHLPVMKWDYRDQLKATSKQIVNNGGIPETTYYTYDSLGQRVRKVTERYAALGEIPRRKEDHYYLGGYEIHRKYDGDGNTITLEREISLIMDDIRCFALIETRTVGDDGSPEELIRYQFDNHLGSSSLELDRDAHIISYEEYYPYGSTSYQAVRRDIEVPTKRYRYTGKERDDDTGLYYFGARYYASWLGRWTSCDPLGIQDGLNVFIYVSDSPTRLIDPNGMQSYPEHEDPNAKEMAKQSRLLTNYQGGWTYKSMPGVIFFEYEPGTYAFTNGASGSVHPVDNKQISIIMKNSHPILNHLNQALYEVPENLLSKDPGEISVTGIRTNAEGPRQFYRNPRALDYAMYGYTKQAEIWEAGHGCAACHVEHFTGGPVPNSQLDLKRYDIAARGFVILRLMAELTADVSGTYAGMGGGGGAGAGGGGGGAGAGGGGSPKPPLGDLTKAEIREIQSVVDKAGRPLEVAGSAAAGTRRGVGTDLPIGKGAGTRSDIDYLVPPGSMPYYKGLETKLPSLAPEGIIPGTHNPFIGPGIRFEPGVPPRFIPPKPAVSVPPIK